MNDIVFSLECQDIRLVSKKIHGVIKELEIISYNGDNLLTINNIKTIITCIDIRRITSLKIQNPTSEALIFICNNFVALKRLSVVQKLGLDFTFCQFVKNLVKLEEIKFRTTYTEEGFPLLENACELLKSDNPKLKIQTFDFKKQYI